MVVGGGEVEEGIRLRKLCWAKPTPGPIISHFLWGINAFQREICSTSRRISRARATRPSPLLVLAENRCRLPGGQYHSRQQVKDLPYDYDEELFG